MDQAKEVGKEKLEQAKEVANAAVGTATKEAEQRGLKPSPSTQQDSGKPAVGVYHSFSDAPAQAVPPTPKPSVTPKPTSGNSGGPRNTS
jgi:hypothetical protein